MSRQSLTSAAKRRDFMKLAVVAGGTLAIGGVAKTTLAKPEQKKRSGAPSTSKQGYRETAHIRAYYDKARI